MAKLTIYKEVAKNAFMNWFGKTEQEAIEAVSNSTMEELESQVWATGSLSSAADEVIKQSPSFFNRPNYAAAIKEGILKGDGYKDPAVNECFYEMMEELKNSNNLYNEGKDVVEMLSGVHDGWVKSNAKKFNQDGRESKKYQHLPLELIGFEEAKADLLFLAPILNHTIEPITEEELKTQYSKRVEAFLVKNNIQSKEDLIEAIAKGEAFYPALSEINSAKSQEEAKMMAEQVLEKCHDIKKAFSKTLGN